MRGIPITTRASIPRPSSTTTNSSARRTCSRRVHAAHSPEVRCPTDGGASACPEAVGDAPHVRGRGAARSLRASTRSIRAPSSTWTPKCGSSRTSTPTIVRASCSAAHIYWLATRDRPVPDAKVAIYPFKRSFVVGAVSTDVQSGLGDDVLSAGHRDAGARVLVHQHGRGGQDLLHHRRDGPRGELLGTQMSPGLSHV